MMQPLSFRLLGDFCVACGDQPITSISSTRLQSLLAYLLLHSDAPQSRQHLAFVLYPDSSETQARTNLRNLFHLLRHALPDADCYLASDTLTLQWRTNAPYTLDVADFEHELVNSTDRSASRERASIVRDLQSAIELYRGDLLPSCYDDWILPERERLRQEYIRTLERLIQVLVEQQDYRAALTHAQRLLQWDPLREETYRTLMYLSAWSGDRAGVVRFYNTCVQVMRREFDVEPSEGTRSAYEQLLGEISTVQTPVQRPSPAVHPNNLPLYLDRFVGRERETHEVKQLVSEHRIVTLVGAGGVGKTRLGIASASELLPDFADGIRLVDLAPLSDPALLPQTVASALGVREVPGHPLIETLTDSLRGKQLLLVLDNCEHMVQSARHLVECVLHAAPKVRILATSRHVLGIAGERVFSLPPLRVPKVGGKDFAHTGQGIAALAVCESVMLFVERAVAVLPTFALTNENAAAVAHICQRLDGIPLAIELAAARINLLNPGQIAARLDDAFCLLTRANHVSLSHHQTLRAAMDWSYEALSEKERVLLRRLSVFAGGFTLEAVEAVCVDGEQSSPNAIQPACVLDVLSDLVDKSLVALEPRNGGTRMYLLEIVRQYARERIIRAGDEPLLRRRHLMYFLGVAEREANQIQQLRQASSLKELLSELDNFRAALEWSALNESDVEAGLRMVCALEGLWEWVGHITEARRWLESLLEQNRTDSPIVRAKAMYVAGLIAFHRSDVTVARSLVEQSLELYRKLGDYESVCDILTKLGALMVSQCEFGKARELLEECLEISTTLAQPGRVAYVMLYLGICVYFLGDWAEGHELLEKSLRTSRELGAPIFIGHATLFLGHMARLEADYTLATSLYRESLCCSRDTGALFGILYALEAFGYLAAAENQPRRAAQLFGAAERLQQTIGTSLVRLEQREHDRCAMIARKGLGERSFAKASAEGQGMSQEQAIELALATYG